MRSILKHRLWRRLGFLTAVLLPLLFLESCDMINPEEATPAYLYLQPFELRTQAGSEGSAAHRITEAWLSVDGEFLGAYSLPAQVPLLAPGGHEITLEAGIRENGLSATPEIYPFYEVFRTSRDLAPNRVDTIRPSIRYTERTRFALIEDFERGAPAFQELRAGTNDNQLRLVETGVFEGTASGRIRLDTHSPSVELATVARFRSLTSKSPFVYLELNYRSDVPVVFGIIGYRDGIAGPGVARFDPGFRPRSDWNKIYFNLSPLLADGSFDEIQIALQATIPQENGVFTLQEAFIWLDNIKLVHF